MSDAGKSNGAPEDIQLIFEAPMERENALTQAFGEDKLATILDLEEQTLKAELENYNYKVKLFAPIYQKRSEFIKTIPGFWLKAITNFPQVANFVDPVDRDALEHLEDLKIEHDPKDARNVTFHFHWSKANPYFSDRVLSKAFTAVTEASNGTSGDSSHAPESQLKKLTDKYDLDVNLSSVAVPINWSSKDHDLVAKKPFVDITEVEEYDAFTGSVGSFFNFFACTDDRFMMHATLLELHAKALDLYAGLNEADDDEDLNSEDEEDEDDDPSKVVDLGDDSNDEADLPKKKKAKTSAK